jgi:hypothetical protein
MYKVHQMYVPITTFHLPEYFCLPMSVLRARLVLGRGGGSTRRHFHLLSSASRSVKNIGAFGERKGGKGAGRGWGAGGGGRERIERRGACICPRAFTFATDHLTLDMFMV